MTLLDLRRQEYTQRMIVTVLRRQVFERINPASAPESLRAALLAAEHDLGALTRQRAAAQAIDPRRGQIFGTGGSGEHEVRGARTTGLQASAMLRMAQVPTSIYHLFDRLEHPLVSCTIRNVHGGVRRLRVVSFVEGYTARAIDTIELDIGQEATVTQLPTLFPERLREVNELTAATVNVMIEELGGQIELHATEPVPLLARTTAPLAVGDPATGQWTDLTRYLAAFVTPNAPAVMTFLRGVADHHPDHNLVGYQGSRDGVLEQVNAVFDALKSAGITYVNSLISFSPDEGAACQRVRLPRESLADRQANCIDGTVLMASLLEAMSINPAIVIVPGHAFLGWETWHGSGQWCYLETTMIGVAGFQQARDSAEQTAELYRDQAQETGDQGLFRLWSMAQLRSDHGITPME